jgi:hypothetical protein
VPAGLGFGDDGRAVAGVQRVGAAGEEECGGVGVQGLARLDVAVVLDVAGVAEQGPSVAVVVLDVVPGVEEVSQAQEVFLLDREMSG